MIAPGPHSICYSREVVEPGGSIGVSSHDITIDRNPYRLQYLAVLLETSVEKLDFNPEPAYGLGWKGSEDYVFEINRIRAELQDSYSRLVALCLTRELLTEIEAVELIPEFSISVYDYRKDRTVPIPPLEIVQSVTALP